MISDKGTFVDIKTTTTSFNIFYDILMLRKETRNAIKGFILTQ